MRRKTVIWFVSLLVIVGIGIGSFFAYRAYRVYLVEREVERFTEWLKDDVLEVNPVEVTGGFGEHGWTGAWYAVNVRTPTGAKFSIQVLIVSSITETKIAKLWIYQSSLTNIEALTTQQLADIMQNPKGTDIQLPLELVGSRQPVDLKAYLPKAFERPPRGD